MRFPFEFSTTWFCRVAPVEVLQFVLAGLPARLRLWMLQLCGLRGDMRGSMYIYVSLPLALLATRNELYAYGMGIAGTCLAGLAFSTSGRRQYPRPKSTGLGILR